MSKKTRQTRALGVRLPVDLLTILEEIAQEEGERSISSLIRQAVEEFVRRRAVIFHNKLT